MRAQNKNSPANLTLKQKTRRICKLLPHTKGEQKVRAHWFYKTRRECYEKFQPFILRFLPFKVCGESRTYHRTSLIKHHRASRIMDCIRLQLTICKFLATLRSNLVKRLAAFCSFESKDACFFRISFGGQVHVCCVHLIGFIRKNLLQHVYFQTDIF